MDIPDQQTLFLEQQVELLGSRDYRVAGAAYKVLVEAGQVGMDAAIRGLSHSDARVRRGCAEFMDHQGNDQCVTTLSQVAREDSVPYVRRVAVHSLGCERCKPTPLQGDTISFLIERALSDPSTRVRREAVSGLLFQPPDPRAAAALKTVLSCETDRKLRGSAHYALKHHDPEYRRMVDEQARARSIAAYESKLEG
jgi:HEAT repeat protein